MADSERLFSCGGAIDATKASTSTWGLAYNAFYDCALATNFYFWPDNEAHRSVRVLALLFTALAVESGDVG